MVDNPGLHKKKYINKKVHFRDNPSFEMLSENNHESPTSHDCCWSWGSTISVTDSETEMYGFYGSAWDKKHSTCKFQIPIWIKESSVKITTPSWRDHLLHNFEMFVFFFFSTAFESSPKLSLVNVSIQQLSYALEISVWTIECFCRGTVSADSCPAKFDVLKNKYLAKKRSFEGKYAKRANFQEATIRSIYSSET